MGLVSEAVQNMEDEFDEEAMERDKFEIKHFGLLNFTVFWFISAQV